MTKTAGSGGAAIDDALRASEERFRTLIEKAPIAIGMAREGVTLYANLKYLEMYGFERVEEVQGRSIGEQWAPGCRAEIEERARRRAAGLLLPTEYDAVGQRKDGSTFPVHAAVTLVQLADGPCSLAFLTDITRQKTAEEELARSELYFRSLIENAVDITAILAPEGHLRYVSPSVERILGYKPGDISGLNIFDLVHPEDRERAAALLRRILETGTKFERIEFRLRHFDDSWRTLSIIGKPLPPETGMAGLILNAQDLTERLQLEAQLRQAQKMEAVGRLAGGVAHDFNNLLTVIQGYGEVLQSTLTGGDPNSAPVEEILKAAERAASLTRQLLAFSRKQVLLPRVVSLNDVVRNVDRMLRRLIGEDVELVISLGTVLGSVKADPSQIEQVLMNLAVNARDAMPDGGRLTIEVANADLGDSGRLDARFEEEGPSGAALLYDGLVRQAPTLGALTGVTLSTHDGRVQAEALQKRATK